MKSYDERMAYKDKGEQTSYQLEWIRTRRERWIAQQGPCATCGYPDDLFVVHRDPKTRDPRLRSTSAMWTISETRLAQELLKCEVLCRVCYNTRKRKQAEKLECPSGHDLTNPRNLSTERGTPRCLECHRVSSRKRRDNKRAASVL